ncbi:MAG: alpha-L-fucosidase [Victivallales bacterium]
MKSSGTPAYLKDHHDIWNKNQKEANLQWFKDAAFGMFLHYGLYSQLGKGEWAMYNMNIPINEYEKMFDSFNPKHFDADFITDLALEAGMKYVNFTSCHHEGFCLWNSKTEAYNSYCACKRDIVMELAEECSKKGLGFFLYYTHVLNWRHPYSLPRNILEIARPDYTDEKRYELKLANEFKRYWEYVHACLEELLSIEHPLAGIWLDIIMAYYMIPELIPVEETYRLIREKRPEVLISFKQGATGDEDFAAPEHSFNSLADVLRQKGYKKGALLAENAWRKNKNKHNEICSTLQRQGWGYVRDTAHKTPDDLRGELAYALSNNCNLLVNTGPLPDGSIHPEDIKTLRETGKRIRLYGLPGKNEISTPRSWSIVENNLGAGGV